MKKFIASNYNDSDKVRLCHQNTCIEATGTNGQLIVNAVVLLIIISAFHEVLK